MNFNKYKTEKRRWAIKHVALEHGGLLKALIHEELTGEIEYLAETDSDFHKTYEEYFGKALEFSSLFILVF